VDRVHRRWLTGLRTSLNADRWLPDWQLRLNQSNRYLGFESRPFITDPTTETAGSGWGQRGLALAAARRGWTWRLAEFEFSRAMVVGFWWGLLLWDHNDEGNAFMLTLIGGERQRSPATVRWLDRCLAMVRVASSEASAPRTCAKAFLSSLLASRPTNCANQWQKTQIWWLPKVWRVLDLRPKIHTICGAIYRGF
jgi:hypothetical protein